MPIGRVAYGNIEMIIGQCTHILYAVYVIYFAFCHIVYIDVYWFSGHGDVYQHAVLHNFVSHLFISTVSPRALWYAAILHNARLGYCVAPHLLLSA